jgi:hypothetical protein
MEATPIDPDDARCPSCERRLAVIDRKVRVGAGSDQHNWHTGYLLRCAEHGDWHLLEGAAYLTKVEA